MVYSDKQLKDAVDAVFDQFDKDGSNTLDAQEVASLINAALANMKIKRQATQNDVQSLIHAVDKNNDGKIGRPELFEIFKKVTGSS
jgi:Ca2+-binding EF-hand superfamily protein